MTFVMALASAAVGLGNLWRFSYLAGEHGGGWFVLTYIVCLLVLAVPVLVAELVLGNHGRGSPFASFGRAVVSSGRSRWWRGVGILATACGVLVASYGCVVASWGLVYALKLQGGDFAAVSIVVAANQLEQFLAQPYQMMRGYAVFVAVVLAVSFMGVRRGIGLLAWFLIPLLIVGMWVLAQYGLRYGDLEAAKGFLFAVEPLDFSPESILIAAGQAFYTLGIGVGVGVAYGAYAPERVPIGRSVLAVALFDTLIALVAGVAIFPLLFANNVEPAQGPALIFIALPYAFGNTPDGDVYGALFYIVFAMAALGSAVALLEPAVSTLRQAFKIRRILAVVLAGAVCASLGLGVVLSFDLWQARFPLGGRHFFGFLEHLSAVYLVPASALLLTVFVGWRMRREVLRIELYRESRFFFSLWLAQLRYIAPLIIIVLFWFTALS